MKHLKFFLFALSALVCLNACNENAPEGGGSDDPKPGEITWKFVPATNTLIFSGSGAMANYTADNRPEWDKYKEYVTTVKIADEEITSIGDYAFYGFIQLQTIQLPPVVEKIGKMAFAECSALEEVQLTRVHEMGDGVFYHCMALKTVDLSLTAIRVVPADFCGHNENLMTVILPTTVSEIGVSAFSYCSHLTKVQVSGYDNPVGLEFLDLTKIGEGAFYLCQTLPSFNLPASLKELNAKAFANCYSIREVSLGDSNNLLLVGDSAFAGCTNLKTVTYNKQCRLIGSYMFANCINLESITSINALTTIGKCAFRSCSKLEGFAWNTGLETIGEYAFYACTALKEIKLYANVQTVGKGAFLGCHGVLSLSITSYYLKRIEDDTFYQLRKISSVTLPSCVEYIGNQAFAFCTSLMEVTCKNPKPPTLGGQSAFTTNAGSKLRVPKNSVSDYEASPWYNYFSAIEGVNL